jgi:hypothetical protein
MKIFGDLYIRGTIATLAIFIDNLNKNICGHWKRDVDVEKSIPSLIGEKYYCYRANKTDHHPGAALWISEKDENILYVTNIVPNEVFKLTYDEYNTILREFFEEFVLPVAKSTGVTTELSNTDVPITHWIDSDAEKKLKGFSAAANKSTGSSHPLDEERWFDFIISVHQTGRILPVDILGRWLEENDWGEDEISDLQIEYEKALALLKQYDKHR